MTKLNIIIVLGIIVSCNTSNHNHNKNHKSITPKLNLEQANKLAQLPLHCIDQEYPNKMGHVTASPIDQKRPIEQHPVFYGCFDWHSAVHGFWSSISLIKQFNNLPQRDQLLDKIQNQLTPTNIAVEINYLNSHHNTTFERTYGWAWVLKLQQELDTWNDPIGKELAQNLQPLTDLIIDRYIKYLPKLNYAIRVGEHSNTAFAMVFAWDYAQHVQHKQLINVIESTALKFYQNDTDCPISWEPSGYDFLSPCLEQLDIMRRILPDTEFHTWVQQFLPAIIKSDLSLKVGMVSDRSDGKLVHIDGLNLSRAWVLYGLISQYPQQYQHLKPIADAHLTHTLPNLVADDYAGGHWLGSFAIYALNNAQQVNSDPID